MRCSSSWSRVVGPAVASATQCAAGQSFVGRSRQVDQEQSRSPLEQSAAGVVEVKAASAKLEVAAGARNLHLCLARDSHGGKRK